MNDSIRITRRRFIAIAATTLGGAVLAACGQAAPAAPTQAPAPTAAPAEPTAAPTAAPVATTKPAAAEPVNITFMSVWAPGDAPQYKGREKVWNKFIEKNPNVKVEYQFVSYDQFGIQLVNRVLAGDAPAVAQAGYNTPQFVKAGALVQTDPFMERDGVSKENGWRALWEIVEYQGKTYGLPFTIDTRFTFTNPDLYKQIGVEYPKTLDDILASAKAARDAGVHIIGMEMVPEVLQVWQTTASLIKQAGSDFIKINPDGTASANLQTPEAIDMVNFIMALQKQEAVAESFLTDGGAEVSSMFSQGKLGMYPIGNWFIGLFDTWIKDGNMKFQPELIHHPIRKQKGSAAGGWSWYAFNTIDPEMGWSFINFYNQDENVNEGWPDALSPTKSGMKTQYYASDPRNAFVSEVLEYSTWVVPAAAGWFEGLTLIGRNLMKAFSGQMSAEAALEAGQKEVQDHLDAGHNKLIKG